MERSKSAIRTRALKMNIAIAWASNPMQNIESRTVLSEMAASGADATRRDEIGLKTKNGQ